MSRKLRVEYPGAIYHLMNRGDRSEPVFRDSADRKDFLRVLGQVCKRTGWQIHAYCLMRNHFHLVAETPDANLVAGMKWLLGTYSIRFNRRHRVVGHLFAGRYKSLVVDGSTSGYFKTVCDYVHLNPARAKLVKADQDLSDFPWSSWPEYMKTPKQRVPWLKVDRLLGEHGIPKDSAAGRRALKRAMDQRRLEDEPEEYKSIRRGWCFGDDEFKKELLGQMSERISEHHFGSERNEAAKEKAERIIKEELNRKRWTEAKLKRARKGALEKVEIATRLRKETTASVKWIATRLHMGSPSNTSNHILAYGKIADSED